MPDALLTSPTSFSVTRVLDATPEAVFKAWTDPNELKAWWSPPDVRAESVVADVRVGGKYRIGNRMRSGEIWYVSGSYREVRPPEKLVFTWAWEEDAGLGPESLVTLEFRRRGAQTELVLTHAQLANVESRDGHLHGWEGCFDGLAAHLTQK